MSHVTAYHIACLLVSQSPTVLGGFTVAGSSSCDHSMFTPPFASTLMQKKVLDLHKKIVVNSSASNLSYVVTSQENGAHLLFNDENIEKAFEEFVRFFPEHAEDIKTHKKTLISNLTANPPHTSCGTAEGAEKCPV